MRVHTTTSLHHRNQCVQNKSSVVVGLPDLTPSQHAHVSGYATAASTLRAAGYEQIFVAAVAPADQLDAFLLSLRAEHSAGLIAGLADPSGGFTRMLGLDINAPGTGAPFSQRYLGMVKDGILTRLVRSVSGAIVCTSHQLYHRCRPEVQPSVNRVANTDINGSCAVRGEVARDHRRLQLRKGG